MPWENHRAKKASESNNLRTTKLDNKLISAQNYKLIILKINVITHSKIAAKNIRMLSWTFIIKYDILKLRIIIIMNVIKIINCKPH